MFIIKSGNLQSVKKSIQTLPGSIENKIGRYIASDRIGYRMAQLEWHTLISKPEL